MNVAGMESNPPAHPSDVHPFSGFRFRIPATSIPFLEGGRDGARICDGTKISYLNFASRTTFSRCNVSRFRRGVEKGMDVEAIEFSHSEPYKRFRLRPRIRLRHRGIYLHIYSYVYSYIYLYVCLWKCLYKYVFIYLYIY